MNSEAHSENPLKRVQEGLGFETFSLTLYGFELLALEFIPGRTGRSRRIRHQYPLVARATPRIKILFSKMEQSQPPTLP
jgi:hypothetical protein